MDNHPPLAGDRGQAGPGRGRIWAAWSKMRNPLGFVQAVRAYDATPEWLSKAIGYGLPILELCSARC